MSGFEQDIANTFYHLLLNCALDLRVQKIDRQNQHQLIRNAIESVSGQPMFWTLEQKEVTSDNVPEMYRELFGQLHSIKTKEDIDSLTIKIIERETFQSAFLQLTQFFADLSTDQKQEVSDSTIQETFYNQMVCDVFDLPFLSREAIKQREPFIYIGLSSQAIISRLILTPEFRLCNGALLTESNCPHSFLEAFHALQSMQPFFAGLSSKQIELIRYFATTDPDLLIPDDLLSLKNPDLMKLVAMVTALAIEISSIPHFKKVIEHVIAFCLQAMGESSQHRT
jgi:hypothetical protein